jgi:hypothetical protein
LLWLAWFDPPVLEFTAFSDLKQPVRLPNDPSGRDAGFWEFRPRTAKSLTDCWTDGDFATGMLDAGAQPVSRTILRVGDNPPGVCIAG